MLGYAIAEAPVSGIPLDEVLVVVPPVEPPVSGGGGGGGPVRAVRDYAKQFDRADKPTRAQKKARRRAIEAEALELLPDLPQAPLIAPQIASIVYQQTAPAFAIATPGVLVNGLPQAVMAALRLEVEAYLQQIARQEEIDDENVSELLLLG